MKSEIVGLVEHQDRRSGIDEGIDTSKSVAAILSKKCFLSSRWTQDQKLYLSLPPMEQDEIPLESWSKASEPRAGVDGMSALWSFPTTSFHELTMDSGSANPIHTTK